MAMNDYAKTVDALAHMEAMQALVGRLSIEDRFCRLALAEAAEELAEKLRNVASTFKEEGG